MRQRIVSIMICGMFAGCAAPNNGSWWDGWGALASAGDEYQFDFAWELTGSDHLAPLQVFSNAQQLWLQFAGDVSLPTLFALREGGLVPLQAQKQGVYHVVNSRVDVLLLRRGTEQAWAYRSPFMPALQSYLRKQHTMAVVYDQQRNESQVRALPIEAVEPIAREPQKGSKHSGVAIAVDVGQDSSSRHVESSGPITLQERVDTEVVHDTFTSHASDRNLKQLLQRWALAADWVFNDEHWAVSVEIPLSGPFSYQGDFTDAVQQLLLSTQLGDYPLRPCFYSNQVLRVVPLTGKCMAVGS